MSRRPFLKAAVPKPLALCRRHRPHIISISTLAQGHIRRPGRSGKRRQPPTNQLLLTGTNAHRPPWGGHQPPPRMAPAHRTRPQRRQPPVHTKDPARALPVAPARPAAAAARGPHVRGPQLDADDERHPRAHRGHAHRRVDHGRAAHRDARLDPVECRWQRLRRVHLPHHDLQADGEGPEDGGADERGPLRPRGER